jgi:hypothetical protein
MDPNEPTSSITVPPGSPDSNNAGTGGTSGDSGPLDPRKTPPNSPQL